MAENLIRTRRHSLAHAVSGARSRVSSRAMEGDLDPTLPFEELAAKVAGIDWFHTIALPGGIVTPGVTDPGRTALPRIGLAARLDGCSVLDVGAWDGFFSF